MMSAVTGVGGVMSLYRTTLALMVTAFLCLSSAGAQERTVRVGVPAGPLIPSPVDQNLWTQTRTLPSDT